MPSKVRVFIDATGLAPTPPGGQISVPIKAQNVGAGPCTVTCADFAIRFDPGVLRFRGLTLGNLADGSLSTQRWSFLSNVVESNTILMTGSTAEGPQLLPGESGRIFNLLFDVLLGVTAGGTVLNMLDRGGFTALADNQLNPLTLTPPVSDAERPQAAGGEDARITVGGPPPPPPTPSLPLVRVELLSDVIAQEVLVRALDEDTGAELFRGRLAGLSTRWME
jgi:hypothetical protein